MHSHVPMQLIANPDSGLAPASRAAIPTDRAGRLSVWIYVAWLATYVVEGPLRGALSSIGAANLLYLRDLVGAASIAVALVGPLLHKERPAPGLVLMAWLLAVHVCIGLLLGGTVFQRLFGIKIFVPVLYALALYPVVQRHFGLFMRAMGLFFVIASAGVFINAVVGEMPWEGLKYDTAFGAVQTTRQWWMSGGVSRLPGFARASFDAAMVIGVCGVLLLAALRPVWLRAAVAAAGLAAIFLTTSKGMVVAFAVAALWLVPANRSAASFKSGRVLVAVLMLVTCLVPTLFMIVSVPEHPTEMPPLLSSLWDRFSWMWPNAYELLPDGFGALTGVGPGGIGTALEHPEELVIPNSGDSIFVYYFVSFGLAGILYLAWPVLALFKRDSARDPRAFVWAGLLIVTYGYGLSINMVEQSFFASVLGLLYGKAFEAQRSLE